MTIESNDIDNSKCNNCGSENQLNNPICLKCGKSLCKSDIIAINCNRSIKIRTKLRRGGNTLLC